MPIAGTSATPVRRSLTCILNWRPSNESAQFGGTGTLNQRNSSTFFGSPCRNLALNSTPALLAPPLTGPLKNAVANAVPGIASIMTATIRIAARFKLAMRPSRRTTRAYVGGWYRVKCRVP